MRYLLDSTVLIDHGNADDVAIELLGRLHAEGHELFICDVVTCETLSFGDETNLAQLVALLDGLEYVSTNPAAARWAGASRRRRHRAGGKRAVGDALIAGLAVELGAVVVTRNVDDFSSQGVDVLAY